jgi:Tol biopolymer transport system component
MGEVYRARDTRLQRTVAIKILPEHFSSDSVRKQRFEREARTISRFNHPHICVLHDVGQQDGIDFLVMECVEGETLSKRLKKGPLPLDHVLKYGAQIADALDKAHRSGIVHRDLKPGNIMLAPAGVKLLDFGLARPADTLANATTVSLATPKSSVTEEGMVIGTFPYMSPEQIEGKDLDGRSDIFSLGAVLYEMLTGHRAFEGNSQAAVIGAILKQEPKPISSFQPLTPPLLDRLLRACLAQDPDERIQTAHDVKLQLQWIAEGQPGEAQRVPAGAKRWPRERWLLATAVLLLLMAGGVAWWQASNKRLRPMYFHTSVPFAANDLALSLDGRMLAVVAHSAQVNDDVLWAYEVGGRRTLALAGTQGASYPFWSPDGRFIGFFADGKLKKVDVSGGQVQVLCDAPNGRGGTWNRDGVIVFSPEGLAGLYRVSSWGGSPVEVTKRDASRLEQSHRWPVFLPDGKHFLYLSLPAGVGEGEHNAIFLGSLDSPERRLLVSTRFNAAYAEPGYLLYLRDDKTLVAQPFDSRRYVLSGEPHLINEEVLYVPLVFRAVFGVAGEQVLVSQTGKWANLSQLTWVDRSGRPSGTIGMPATYNNVRLSPDGRRIATNQVDLTGGSSNIWVHEPARGATGRLTFDLSQNTTPIWSPDGRQILFSSNRKLGYHLFAKSADGSGSDAEVTDLAASPWDWSSDGRHVLVSRGSNIEELWHVSWPERVATPIMQATWTVRNAQFSPDTQWMAYASNETGNWEIYVSSFPSGNGKWQVSTGGGQEPRWRRDGQELFFLSADGKMMAAKVTTDPSFRAGSPIALFPTHRRQAVSAMDVSSYDVSADGQKFLILTKVEEANAAPLSILLNWASEMKN